MKTPLKKNYTRPFDGDLVLFDSRKYAKDMAKYVDYLHGEIAVAYDYLHNSGVNLGDSGDQCLQILKSLVKNIEN